MTEAGATTPVSAALWRRKYADVEAVQWDGSVGVRALLEKWGADPVVRDSGDGAIVRIWGAGHGFAGLRLGGWAVRDPQEGARAYTCEQFAAEFAAPVALDDTASLLPDEIVAFGKLLERTEKALTDLQHRLDTEVGQAVTAERERIRERILAGVESRKTTLTWPEDDLGKQGEIDVVPVAAVRELLGPAASRTGAFWLMVTENGEIALSAPCADTLGCLWRATFDGDRVMLGELAAAAVAHTGIAAGRLHASLAAAGAYGPEAAEMNNGRPVAWSSAAIPGGWVCAIPVPGNRDDVCGNPVESEPCPEHRGEWQPE